MNETNELAMALDEAQNALNDAQSRNQTLHNRVVILEAEVKQVNLQNTRLEQMNANLDNLLQEFRIQSTPKNPANIDKG